MESFEKQNYESFFVSGSILNVQDSDEKVVLGSSTAIAEDKDGNDVTTTVLLAGSERLDDDPNGSFADNMLSVRVQAGDEDLSPYKITFRMETDKNNKWEVDVKMKVKER